MGALSYIQEEINVIREERSRDQIQYGSISLSKFQSDIELQDRT